MHLNNICRAYYFRRVLAAMSTETANAVECVLSTRAWTIVTLCSPAYRRPKWTSCSGFKTQSLVSPDCVGVTTSRHLSSNYTSCQSASGLRRRHAPLNRIFVAKSIKIFSTCFSQPRHRTTFRARSEPIGTIIIKTRFGNTQRHFYLNRLVVRTHKHHYVT